MAKDLRLVIVTPETTLVDRDVQDLQIPLYDGQLGVMTGRAPLIGRLGYGTLRLQTAAGPEKYYVDGGFAHVEGDVVNVITARMIPVDLLDSDEASDALEAALELPSATPQEARLKEAAVLRARGQLRASR